MLEPFATKAATTKANNSCSMRVVVLKKAKKESQEIADGLKRNLSRDQILILEETEGFQQGVPRSPGILALNSFGARHAQWNPP